MNEGKSVTSHGSLLLPDKDIEVPQAGKQNPLAIYNSDGEVGLIITPDGDVRLYNQEVITEWAIEASRIMGILNLPIEDREFISDSDPGDEA